MTPSRRRRDAASMSKDSPRESDDAAADPIHDHIPQTRAKNKVRQVLEILDRLDEETVNRRFTH